MDVVDVYYVGGFGVMGWVAASEYSRAQPDALIDHKVGIIEHITALDFVLILDSAERFACGKQIAS